MLNNKLMKNIYFLFFALCFTSLTNAKTYNHRTISDDTKGTSITNDKHSAAAYDVKIVSAAMDKFMIAGAQNYIKATVQNVGTTYISSVEFNWNDGTGDHKERVVTYLGVGQKREVFHPVPASYSDVTTKAISVSITKINDIADENPADNSIDIATSIVSQTTPKKVVIEEGTGTWCGWCTRGIVALDALQQTYPDDQISIAVHGGSSTEPMRLAAYDTFSSFPGMNVDRELKAVDINTSTVLNYVSTRKNIISPAKLGGEFYVNNNQLTANINSQFFINKTNANYKFAVILVEDDVTGTTSGYGQRNYYAGGAYGEMGGFENMPATIPASQMVYKHVGRALLGGYNGQDNSVPTTITDGQTVSYTFSYTIPATQNQDKLYAVLLLLDANDGIILNATKLTKTTLAVNDINRISANTKIYPNPAKSDFSIMLVKDGIYKITIFDMVGREVKNYGNVNSNAAKITNLPINLMPGKYFVNIAQNGVSITKELLVK